MTTDPDKLVRKLWRLRERLSNPMSSVPYVVTGGAWADSCAQCGATKHHRSESGIERCSRCGSAWWEVESKVPKGKRPKVGGNPMERAFHDLARCVAMLSHVPEPARTLYEHHLSPLGGGMRYALDVARRHAICGSMGERAYYDQIRRAREIVGLRLAKAEAVRMSGVSA